MYKPERIIVVYKVPHLGTYSIDEDMIIYKDENKIQNCLKLSDAKSTVAEIIHRDREQRINGLRSEISELELQGTGIDQYKLKNNFI